MPTWTKAEVDFLINNPEMSLREAGKHLGRSRGAVHQKRRLLKTTDDPYRRPGALCGEDHPNSYLTEYSVRSIRNQYAEGNITRLQLAIDFDVEVGTIDAILARKTWRHI